MSEATETQENSGVRFPFVNLEKALERAKELFDADTKGREMSIAAAFSVWKYSEKSSGGFQTIAALKMYGLIRDSGAGKGRKLALTEASLRYFRDEREEEKQKLAQEFALKPKLISVLWQDWGTNPPTDTVARSHLKADRGLNDQASRSLLSIYKENIAFTNIKGDAKILGSIDGESVSNTNDGLPKLSIGDYIQATINGIDQFKDPKRINWVSDDGQYVGVDGERTGIPVTQAQKVKPPAFNPPIPPAGNPQIPKAEVNLMEGERIVFTEETKPKEYLRLVASGEINEFLLDALEDFIKRQKKRLGMSHKTA